MCAVKWRETHGRQHARRMKAMVRYDGDVMQDVFDFFATGRMFRGGRRAFPLVRLHACTAIETLSSTGSYPDTCLRGSGHRHVEGMGAIGIHTI